MKHTKATQLAALQRLEQVGAGFWSRQGHVITINIRMAHGNDFNAWINARSLEDYFGSLCKGSTEPDPMSGTLVLRMKSLMGEAL